MLAADKLDARGRKTRHLSALRSFTFPFRPQTRRMHPTQRSRPGHLGPPMDPFFIRVYPIYPRLILLFYRSYAMAEA